MTRPPTRIAVIGGGFTGTAFAVHLLRSVTEPVTLEIFEPRAALGRGVAYGTPRPEHRINVPSDKMWIFAEAKTDFTAWLARTGRFDGDPQAICDEGYHYSQRRDFGDYVAELLADTRQNAHPESAVTHHQARAVDLVKSHRGGFVVRRADGAEIRTDRAVITASHGTPSVPWTEADDAPSSPAVIRNPWARGAFAHLDPRSNVLVVGTGLTMADVVMSLTQRGQEGHITAISRRGLVPCRHGDFDEDYDFLADVPVPQSALEFLRLIRQRVREVQRNGHSWHRVIDSVRRWLPAIWSEIPVSERHRLIEKLRIYWDIHRYRLAPQVADTLDKQTATGVLTIRAGRIKSVTQSKQCLTVAWQPRGGGPVREAGFDAIVNCTGPTSDVTRSTDPLFQSLIERGLCRPDPLGLGFDVDPTATALTESGGVAAGLHVTGPLARGQFGEVMGVPDASKHARWLAERIADEIHG